MIEVSTDIGVVIIIAAYSALGVYLYYRLDDENIKAMANELGGHDDGD